MKHSFQDALGHINNGDTDQAFKALETVIPDLSQFEKFTKAKTKWAMLKHQKKLGIIMMNDAINQERDILSVLREVCHHLEPNSEESIPHASSASTGEYEKFFKQLDALGEQFENLMKNHKPENMLANFKLEQSITKQLEVLFSEAKANGVSQPRLRPIISNFKQVKKQMMLGIIPNKIYHQAIADTIQELKKL